MSESWAKLILGATWKMVARALSLLSTDGPKLPSHLSPCWPWWLLASPIFLEHTMVTAPHELKLTQHCHQDQPASLQCQHSLWQRLDHHQQQLKLEWLRVATAASSPVVMAAAFTGVSSAFRPRGSLARQPLMQSSYQQNVLRALLLMRDAIFPRGR